MYRAQPDLCIHAEGVSLLLDFPHLTVLSAGDHFSCPRKTIAELSFSEGGWGSRGGVSVVWSSSQQALHSSRPCFFPQGVSFSCRSLEPCSELCLLFSGALRDLSEIKVLRFKHASTGH